MPKPGLWWGSVELAVALFGAASCGAGAASEKGETQTESASSTDATGEPVGASAPSPPTTEHLLAARFDGGVQSWELVGPENFMPNVAALTSGDELIVALRDYEGALVPRIVRIDRNGALVDEVLLETEAHVSSIVVDSEGRVFVAGEFEQGTGYLAFDPELDVLWPLTITTDARYRSSLAIAPDGSVLYAGYSEEGAGALTKLSIDGATQWTRQRPGSPGVTSEAGVQTVAVHADGTILVLLGSGGEDTSHLWLDAFAPDGTPLWGGDRDATMAGGIAVTTAGAFVVSGYEIIFGAGEITEHLWIAAYGPDGEKNWETVADPIGYAPIRACGDGTVLTLHHDLSAVILDAEGNELSTVTYQAGTDDFIRSVDSFCTNDGGVLLVGSMSRPE